MLCTMSTFCIPKLLRNQHISLWEQISKWGVVRIMPTCNKLERSTARVVERDLIFYFSNILAAHENTSSIIVGTGLAGCIVARAGVSDTETVISAAHAWACVQPSHGLYVFTVFYSGWLGSRVVSVLNSGAVEPGFKSQPGNSLRQTVHTHRAYVHQAAKLVAALLRVAGVTAGPTESNGSLPPGLRLTLPAG